MVDVSGVPNLGIPGLSGFSGGAPNNGGYFADPSSGINNAYASQASNDRFFGNQAATQAAATVPQQQLYGPLGFGGQTALSAATGAAYGRGTGGFGGFSGNSQEVDSSLPSGGGSVFDRGTSPVPYPDSPPMGSFSPSPNYTGGRGAQSMFDTGAPPVPYQNSPPMGSFSPSPNYSGGRGAASAFSTDTSPVPAAPNFNQTFGQFVQDSGGRSRNQTALDAVNQFSGVGTGVPAELPPSAGRGVDPRDIITQTLINSGSQTPDFGGIPSGGHGSSNSFADRFAPLMGGNPGTPSQYTSSPYQDIGGTTYQPNIPRGYQTLFSADTPSGALPVDGFRGSPSPSSAPQSYINQNFGEMQPGAPSSGNIVMGDRLRGQGPPTLSPFMSPNAFQHR